MNQFPPRNSPALPPRDGGGPSSSPKPSLPPRDNNANNRTQPGMNIPKKIPMESKPGLPPRDHSISPSKREQATSPIRKSVEDAKGRTLPASFSAKEHLKPTNFRGGSLKQKNRGAPSPSRTRPSPEDQQTPLGPSLLKKATPTKDVSDSQPKTDEPEWAIRAKKSSGLIPSDEKQPTPQRVPRPGRSHAPPPQRLTNTPHNQGFLSKIRTSHYDSQVPGPSMLRPARKPDANGPNPSRRPPHAATAARQTNQTNNTNNVGRGMTSSPKPTPARAKENSSLTPKSPVNRPKTFDLEKSAPTPKVAPKPANRPSTINLEKEQPPTQVAPKPVMKARARTDLSKSSAPASTLRHLLDQRREKIEASRMNKLTRQNQGLTSPSAQRAVSPPPKSPGISKSPQPQRNVVQISKSPPPQRKENLASLKKVTSSPSIQVSKEQAKPTEPQDVWNEVPSSLQNDTFDTEPMEEQGIHSIPPPPPEEDIPPPPPDEDIPPPPPEEDEWDTVGETVSHHQRIDYSALEIPPPPTAKRADFSQGARISSSWKDLEIPPASSSQVEIPPVNRMSQNFARNSNRIQSGHIGDYLQEILKCDICNQYGHRSKDCTQGDKEEQDEGIVFTQHRDKLMIKAATLQKLIESLYSDRETISDFITEFADQFLLTYRTFTTASEIFKHLRQSYQNFAISNDDKFKAKRLRIGNFLKRWAQNHYYDFEGNEQLVNEYKNFIRLMEQTDSSLAKVLEKTLEKGKEKGGKSSLRPSLAPAPKPILPKTIAPDSSVTDIDPVEMARQMSIQEFELFRAITPQELLTRSWSKEELMEECPNLYRMIERFNYFSSWISYNVVKEENLKKRASIVCRLIKVAKECANMNNYNGVFEVVSGLQQSPVYRLKKTWELVRKEKEYSTFEQLLDFTNNTSSFAFYREKLHSSNPPCIPYLGVYQSDLVFIEEGNSDFVENGYINFFKRRLTAEVIQELQTYQHQGYNFAPVESFELWWRGQDSIPIDENVLYKVSLAIEPREGKKATKRSQIKSKPEKSKSGIRKQHNSWDGGDISSVSRPKLNKFFGEEDAFNVYTNLQEKQSDATSKVVSLEKATSAIDLTADQIEEYKRKKIEEYQREKEEMERRQSQIRSEDSISSIDDSLYYSQEYSYSEEDYYEDDYYYDDEYYEGEYQEEQY